MNLTIEEIQDALEEVERVAADADAPVDAPVRIIARRLRRIRDDLAAAIATAERSFRETMGLLDEDDEAA